MTLPADRMNRLRPCPAMAAGAMAPQVSGDIKVYSGPGIPADGITSLQLGALAFDIDLDRVRFSQSTGNNGGPTWENDALGTYVDWNGDHEFTGPGEFLGSSLGVGPYFVQTEVPEDHPGGHVRLRLRLQDVDQDPMSPCGTALCGDPADCPGDLNGDDEVGAADLGLQIVAWGARP